MTWSLTGTVGDARGSSAGRGRSRRARASSPVTGSLFDPDEFDDADAPRDGARTTEAPAQPRALTVTEALGYAQRALEGRTLVVEGEVTEFNCKPGYKAAYFTVADASSPMSCMMWRDRYKASGMELRAGMRVRMTGMFTVYVPKGRMQFSVARLEPAGEGDLRQRVARIAERLRREGLMDDARKRPIPAFCQSVCVVTSPRGKAVHDVIRTLRRRNPLVRLLVCGVAVEGADAVAQLTRGLEVAAQARPDAILLVRGGGSYEDLMPFNDEGLARAVSASPVPVVTGIGHEPDTTLCDFVSDRRCSTPTAAAESVAPDLGQLTALLDGATTRLANAMGAQVASRSRSLELLASRPVLASPYAAIVGARERMLDQAQDRLVGVMPDLLGRRAVAASALATRLGTVGGQLLASEGELLGFLSHRLRHVGPAIVDGRASALASTAGRLDALSPLAVIARGYAMATDEAGHVVSSVGDVSVGDVIGVRVADGTLSCEVLQGTPRACEDGCDGRPAPARREA
ncbi:exodeoxyribonuclease VII large subunit [bacterium]|nr:exodeoxyribonuclease VII large subunit [bacterium]